MPPKTLMGLQGRHITDLELRTTQLERHVQVQDAFMKAQAALIRSQAEQLEGLRNQLQRQEEQFAAMLQQLNNLPILLAHSPADSKTDQSDAEQEDIDNDGRPQQQGHSSDQEEDTCYEPED